MSDVRVNGEQYLRVMLVDDEVGFIDVMRKRLTRRGLNVVTAASGAEAVKIMRKNEFDVVVADLKLEDMDGVELMRILRLMDPMLPVIMLTGHGSELPAKQLRSMGAFDYLVKPCSLDDLVCRIQAAAEGGKRHASATCSCRG
ncbi:response regulator [Desulfovibrio inopinatus]|uniref:response regulator n=1 Tax=Desulfovibrio inopinatus TaxID=102109 RepID=UPI00040A1276|nr:response regulator [Desulfovibrio inopinatus]